MVRQGYRLTFVLLLAGSDLGTTQQTVAVAAESPDEAVEVAQRYRSTLPSAAIVSATLADATGAVLWSEQNGGTLDLEPPGGGSAMIYTVVRLATGSYDVLLDGNLIAALTGDIDGSEDEWRIDLLDETPPSERPPPFEAQSHTFGSYRAALNWLGILKEAAVRRPPSARKSIRSAPRYRTYPSPSDRYRLRLLAKRSRFYATTIGLGGLISRGYIAATGQTDDEGRAEWVITDTGRAALSELEA